MFSLLSANHFIAKSEPARQEHGTHVTTSQSLGGIMHFAVFSLTKAPCYIDVMNTFKR